jgi:hypothetical protein
MRVDQELHRHASRNAAAAVAARRGAQFEAQRTQLQQRVA